MNKQRYLAELQRLLVFMTPGDRERTVRRFAYRFDAAGPAGEETLLAELGSPTKAAIDLSRGYTPDSVPEPVPAEPAPEETAAEPAPEKDPDDPWEEIPDFTPPSLEEAVPAPPAETPAPKPEPKPAPRPVPRPVRPAPAAVVPAADEEEAEPRIERTMPLGLGIPLFILVLAALGIPLGVLTLAVCAVLLAPGAAILYAAWLFFVGGLWCTGFMADAILLFGVCAVVLALGLMVLFLGLWLAVTLLRLYSRGVGWVAGELLGRRVSGDA